MGSIILCLKLPNIQRGSYVNINPKIVTKYFTPLFLRLTFESFSKILGQNLSFDQNQIVKVGK